MGLYGASDRRKEGINQLSLFVAGREAEASVLMAPVNDDRADNMHVTVAMEHDMQLEK